MLASKRLSDDEIDLQEYPPSKLIKPIQPGQHITVGDAHANALKLIQFLILHGIFSMSPESYQELVKIYEDPAPLSKEQMNRFYEILAELTTIKIQKGVLIRFLGDMLADRGKNDLLILILLGVLHENNVPFKTHGCNHDAEFQRNWEKFQADCSLTYPVSSLIARDSIKSMTCMAESIKSRVISESAVHELYDQFYLPHHELITYSLEEKGGLNGRPKVNLFWHAPTDISDIAHLGKYLGIDVSSVFQFFAKEHQFEDGLTEKELCAKLLKTATPQKLFKIIDKINEEIRRLMVNKQFYSKFQLDSYDDNPEVDIRKNPAHIIARFIWRREVISRCAWGYQQEKDLPFDVEVNHGHDSNSRKHGVGFSGYNEGLGQTGCPEATKGTLTRRCSSSKICDILEIKADRSKRSLASILGIKKLIPADQAGHTSTAPPADSKDSKHSTDTERLEEPLLGSSVLSSETNYGAASAPDDLKSSADTERVERSSIPGTGQAIEPPHQRCCAIL